jgi:hypothetical protein
MVVNFKWGQGDRVWYLVNFLANCNTFFLKEGVIEMLMYNSGRVGASLPDPYDGVPVYNIPYSAVGCVNVPENLVFDSYLEAIRYAKRHSIDFTYSSKRNKKREGI